MSREQFVAHAQRIALHYAPAASEAPWGTKDGPCPFCKHVERHYWSVNDAVCDGCGGRCPGIGAPAAPREDEIERLLDEYANALFDHANLDRPWSPENVAKARAVILAAFRRKEKP